MKSNLFFGGSIAAHQCEGGYNLDGKGVGIMDLVTSGSVNKPRQFHKEFQNDAYYPSHTGIDFYHTYPKDIKLFAEAGFNTLRISIDWTRIYPTGEEEIPNQAGIDFYRDVIEELRKYQIEPIVTLFHFEMPIHLVNKYGSWQSRKTVELYLKYCNTVFKEFRGLVKYWSTFNEMNHLDSDVELTDLFTYINTGLLYSQLDNPKQVMANCAYNMTLASAMAVNIGHQIDSDFQIGCVFGIAPSYPNTCKPEDSIASLQYMDDNLYQIDAMTKGAYPEFKIIRYRSKGIELDLRDEDKIEFIKCRLDWIGLNYYSSTVITTDNNVEDRNFYGGIQNPYLKASDWGWTIDPEGLCYALIQFDRRYNIPILVTENGLGAVDKLTVDGKVNDQYRIDYMEAHIAAVKNAIDNYGVNCLGYLMWGPIDLVSATTGEMKKRYGLIYVDLDDSGQGTGKRYLKDSYYWYKQYISSNR